MAKRISMKLSTDSIGKAILELNAYRAGLKAKADELRDLIAETIRWTAADGFSTALADDIIRGGTPVYSNVSVSVSTSGDVTVVMADGEHAIFIEFGAGVWYNGSKGQSPNPLNDQNHLGFTIGEYGKGYGKKNAWGLPGSTSTNPIISRGTPAAMPMYHGVQDAVANLVSLARQVFGN